MKQKIHILYISGFGTKYDAYRLRLLRLWKFRDVTVELLPMKWEGKETFEQKLARIDQAIDGAVGKRIVLLGESAGGSMAIHMYARRPDDVYRFMTICGKNAHPETVGQPYYDRSPAFRESMRQLESSTSILSEEQRQAFVSFHPLYDPVVPVHETLLLGCKQVRLPAVGHLFVILLGLTIFSPAIIYHARKRPALGHPKS